MRTGVGDTRAWSGCSQEVEIELMRRRMLPPSHLFHFLGSKFLSPPVVDSTKHQGTFRFGKGEPSLSRSLVAAVCMTVPRSSAPVHCDGQPRQDSTLRRCSQLLVATMDDSSPGGGLYDADERVMRMLRQLWRHPRLHLLSRILHHSSG